MTVEIFLKAASSFKGASLLRSSTKQKKRVRISGKVTAAATIATTPYEEIAEYEFPLQFLVSLHLIVDWKSSSKIVFLFLVSRYAVESELLLWCDCKLLPCRYARPSWAMFELGRAPVYWKTMNGLAPMSVSWHCTSLQI